MTPKKLSREEAVQKIRALRTESAWLDASSTVTDEPERYQAQASALWVEANELEAEYGLTDEDFD